jgi:hypothetical protein
MTDDVRVSKVKLLVELGCYGVYLSSYVWLYDTPTDPWRRHQLYEGIVMECSV